MRQLKRDGSLGSYRNFAYVDYQTVVDRLKKDGSDAEIATHISLNSRGPSITRMDNAQAISWLMSKRGTYIYDATYYEGNEGTMHVAALSARGLL